MTTSTLTCFDLRDGERLRVARVAVVDKKTSPRPLYTEGTLLADMQGASRYVQDRDLRKAMKATGLGTAATRHESIEGLKHARYMVLEKGNLIPTEKGIAHIKFLKRVVPETINVALTAEWETQLGQIAAGEIPFEPFVTSIEKVTAAATDKLRLHSKPPSTTPAKESFMASAPTPKMLEFAQKIASRLNLELPSDVPGDFEACRTFIDANKDAANRPSEKQVNYAESIAKSKGLTVPADVLADSRRTSMWIDEHR